MISVEKKIANRIHLVTQIISECTGFWIHRGGDVWFCWGRKGNNCKEFYIMEVMKYVFIAWL